MTPLRSCLLSSKPQTGTTGRFCPVLRRFGGKMRVSRSTAREVPCERSHTAPHGPAAGLCEFSRRFAAAPAAQANRTRALVRACARLLLASLALRPCPPCPPACRALCPHISPRPQCPRVPRLTPSLCPQGPQYLPAALPCWWHLCAHRTALPGTAMCF